MQKDLLVRDERVDEVLSSGRENYVLDGIPTGRYAGEHWIYTHPDVRPCDVFDAKKPTWILENIPTVQNWTASLRDRSTV